MPTTVSTEPAQTATMRRRPKSSPSWVASAGSYPTPVARRFQFRPFMLTDIEPLAALASEHRIADSTIGVPHPYTKEFARKWISSHSAAWEARRALHWAALKIGDDRLVGYGGLHNIDIERAQAELRFWAGCGAEHGSDAVEWSTAIVEFALTDLKLNRVYALQLDRHPRAGRVVAAIGMHREGLVRKRIYNEGPVEDIVCWGILKNSRQRRTAR